ncbi:MAG: FHA domain-containing protein, partial [Anaerolineae bacterium]|nr:FHA domain-containing protein [Anaerolineae bacterium]
AQECGIIDMSTINHPMTFAPLQPGVDPLNICPFCGHPNRAGILVCDHCGRGLRRDITYDTLVRKPKLPTPEMVASNGQGTNATFAPDACLVLNIVNAPKHFTMRLPLKTEMYVILGRRAPDTSFTPSIDLTPFGAAEKGVSRTHATIYRMGERLILVDLGSTNGTYLNGQRLCQGEEHTLHDRDTISLGELPIRIGFE